MLKIYIESVMAPTPTPRKSRCTEDTCCTVDSYELGERYPDFNMLEPFIADFDVDLKELKKGDIIIKDWQFGHLKNTGYRPLQVTETFDGKNITVTDGNKEMRIYAEDTQNKDVTWHKLKKSGMTK